MRALLLLAVGLTFPADAAEQSNDELSTSNAGPENVPNPEWPQMRAQIEEVRSTLKRETFEQSIENFITDYAQFDAIPLDGISSGFHEFRTILSSRRSIKVLQTLEELPQEERVEKCIGFFHRVMLAQKANFERILQLEKEPGSSEQWPPNLIFSLGLALPATAETGRRDVLAEQFNRLDEYQRYVEKGTRNSEVPVKESFIRMRIKYCIPDNLILLNALRMVATRDPGGGEELLNEVDSLCRSKGIVPAELTTVHWDARTTTFEEHVGSRADTSKGTRTYSLYVWEWNRMTYKEQRTLLREVQRMVFGTAPQ